MTMTRVTVGFTLLAAAIALGSLSGTAWAQDKKSDPAQIARGAKAWAQTCRNCHNLRDPKELTDRNWDVTVNHMRIRAGIPGQVARDIKAFLKASN